MGNPAVRTPRPPVNRLFFFWRKSRPRLGTVVDAARVHHGQPWDAGHDRRPDRIGDESAVPPRDGCHAGQPSRPRGRHTAAALAVEGNVRTVDGPKEAIDGSIRANEGSKEAIDGSKEATKGNIGTFDGPKVTIKGSKEAIEASITSNDGSKETIEGSKVTIESNVGTFDDPQVTIGCNV